jgi:hypothetical protein
MAGVTHITRFVTRFLRILPILGNIRPETGWRPVFAAKQAADNQPLCVSGTIFECILM